MTIFHSNCPVANFYSYIKKLNIQLPWLPVLTTEASSFPFCRIYEFPAK